MNKAELLADLQDQYRNWQALLDQIGPARMDQPGVAEHWSIKDIVAHLGGWQSRLTARIRAAQRGGPDPAPRWPAHLQTDDDINAWIYETNHGRSVREVLEESHRVYGDFLAVVDGLPDDIVIEPAHHVVELGGQRFSMSEFFDHFRDDHEPDVRAWLARVEQA